MIRRLTVLVAATLLALILAAPAALAGGATQISGVGVFDAPLRMLSVTTLKVWAPTLPSS